MSGPQKNKTASPFSTVSKRYTATSTILVLMVAAYLWLSGRIGLIAALAETTWPAKALLGLSGVAVAYILGSVFFGIYRAVFYNLFIIWVRDSIFTETTRNYLKSRFDFGVPIRSWAATRKANVFFTGLEIADLKSDYLRASATNIHLLYVVSFASIIFFIISCIEKNWFGAITFGSAFLISFFSGIMADQHHELLELMFLKRNISKVDAEAKQQGIRKTPAV